MIQISILQNETKTFRFFVIISDLTSSLFIKTTNKSDSLINNRLHLSGSFLDLENMTSSVSILLPFITIKMKRGKLKCFFPKNESAARRDQ